MNTSSNRKLSARCERFVIMHVVIFTELYLQHSRPFDSVIAAVAKFLKAAFCFVLVISKC